MLLIGVSQSLASPKKVINQEDFQFLRLTVRNQQATLETPTTLFSLTAKDDKKQECGWLGICDD
jgi:hypothetical protein